MTHPFVSGQINDDSPLFISASVDNALNLNITVQKKPYFSGSVTGYKLYYTKDSKQTVEEYEDWNNQEVLSNDNSYHFLIDSKRNSIVSGTVYRARATIFFNNVESVPTGILVIHTRKAAPKAPLIVNTKILHNSSVLISFVPADDVNAIENYTLMYKQMEDEEWKSINFQSDVDGKNYGSHDYDLFQVLLDGLTPNQTYEIKMFVSGGIIQGTPSNSASFTTNSTALALIKTDPDEEYTADPQTNEPLSITCTVKSVSKASVLWKVNGIKVSVDSSFYTVVTSVHEDFIESTIRAKSRTRSAKFTCIASNDAGDSAKDVNVVIKGPGSPPSEITLVAEKRGYTISWKPPSHPNGEIKKYVVYHTLNREDPLSDWRKIDLDGSESLVRIIMDTEESFYGRVQAATELGPGIISDIVAMERDTQPITVESDIGGVSAATMVVDPRELLSIHCTARGKPRPSISVAISDRKNASRVEVDVWNRLQATSSGGVVSAMHNFSVLTSKFVHCRAKNSAGSNYSTIELKVDKPGDAPTQVQVLSVNALDATVVWHSPQFPNSPIVSYIILASNDAKEDKSSWLQYESNAKETQINRMLLPTGSLEKSTEYFVCVRAKNAAGIGPTSSLTSFVTLNGGPDSPPDNMKVLINEANQVIVYWNTPNSTTEVTGYLIYYTRDLSLSNDDYKNWQSVEMNNNSTRYKFDLSVGLKPKTFYRVRIAGKNSHADGPVSDVVEFETAYSEVPIPTDLKTEVLDDNTIHIKFSAVRDPDDHSKAVDEYRIDLAATDDVLHAQWKHIEPKAIRIDEISSMVDVEIDGDSVEKNRMYWVKVTAKLDNPSWGMHSSKPRWFRTGHGKLMTTVTLEGTPLIEKEPNLYEKLSVTCTGMGSPAPIITWEWMNESIENGTEGWDIHNVLLDDTTVVSKITRNDIRESGNLTCMGNNNEGNSSASVEIRVLGPGNPPENIKLTAYRNQINVTWQESTLPNGDIMVSSFQQFVCNLHFQKYIVYYSENENVDLSDWNKFETAELETYVEAFGPSTNHFIRVQAVSDRGPGIISEKFSCLSDVLYEPLNLEILASNVMEFEAEPNQNVEIHCKGTGKPTPKLYYQFGNDTEKQFEEVESTDPDSFEAKAPEINSRRNVTVTCRASNKYENVTVSKVIIVKRPGEAPNNISWSFEEEDDSTLYINWNPIENPNGEKLEYNLYLSNYKTKVSGPPVKIPDIPLDVNISLRISAENEYGEGEKTFPIWIPTPNGGPKTAPILSSLHAQDSKVYIFWAEPRLPNGEIQNYTIYIRKESGEEKDGEEEDAMRTDQTPEEWKKYTYGSNITHVIIGIDEGLEENERYQMKMTATNERHEGPETKVRRGLGMEMVQFKLLDLLREFGKRL
ncbi:hypothetical protein CRE_25792 [Caenorhabditis remanei]|uniref:Uncharacterized protein n=1 Tax=Caenorhabditis remanei TaxID=31234 RepID=E3N5N6_CAERE|nr:hypothetical protein CRE_25792 [Caenorhabditis remanei]